MVGGRQGVGRGASPSFSWAVNVGDASRVAEQLTILTGEKYNSVQEFIKVKSWLVMMFSACLRN